MPVLIFQGCFDAQVFDSFDGVKGKESKRTLDFVKYQGIGNDFIMVSILWGSL